MGIMSEFVASAGVIVGWEQMNEQYIFQNGFILKMGH